jgi:hypothetical protein
MSPVENLLRQASNKSFAVLILLGNTADEASMVILALAMVSDPKVRLYNVRGAI